MGLIFTIAFALSLCLLILFCFLFFTVRILYFLSIKCDPVSAFKFSYKAESPQHATDVFGVGGY